MQFGKPCIWLLNALFMPGALHVNIEAPCHENWQQMTPNQQGRYCLACQKTVVDFTAMSDREIWQYMQQATGKVCGRFSHQQLNRDLVVNSVRPSFPFNYGWSLLVSGMLLGSQAFAAEQRPLVKTEWELYARPFAGGLSLQDTTVRQTDTIAARTVQGAVYHPGSTTPIPYVSVMVKGSTKGVLTNEQGQFSIDLPRNEEPVVLELSAVGYEKQAVIVLAGGNPTLTLSLAMNMQTLGEVVIVKVKRKKKAVKKDPAVCAPVEPLSSNKALTIYPNPVLAGSTVNMALRLKQAGDYKLELVDVNGHTVYTQALAMAQPVQTVFFATQGRLTKGTYWVRIHQAGDKQVYSAQMLLQ